MPISVSCRCGQKFTAKDQLAGKTVKCPTCGSPIQIPGAGADPVAAMGQQHPSGSFGPSGWMGTGAGSSPTGLSSMYDEAGMSGSPEQMGPSCPSCMSPMPPHAIICVQCGYNLQLGRRMETQRGIDSSAAGAAHGSETEKIMAKAHQELDDNPMQQAEATFGDEGASTYITALGMVIALFMLVGAGVGFMFLMDALTAKLSVAFVVFMGGALIHGLGWLWMTFEAFLESPVTGILILLFGWMNCVAIGWAYSRVGANLWPFVMVLFGNTMMTFGYVTGGLSAG